LSLLLEHVPFAQSVEGWDVETPVLEKHLELLTSMITVRCLRTTTSYQTGTRAGAIIGKNDISPSVDYEPVVEISIVMDYHESLIVDTCHLRESPEKFSVVISNLVMRVFLPSRRGRILFKTCIVPCRPTGNLE
jgi:hypothetical protein